MSKKSIIMGMLIAVFGSAIGAYIYHNFSSKEELIFKKEQVSEVKKPKIAGVDVLMNDNEQNTWQLKTQKVESINELPIGTFIGLIDTPQKSKSSLSLPMNVTVKEIFVQKGDRVEVGDTLAMATSMEWINAQQELVGASVAKQEQSTLTNRQQLLCDEGIIAKNECKNAHSELRIKSSQIAMTKSTLRAYGASESQISTLLSTSSIMPTFKIEAKTSGIVEDVNVTSGQSMSALNPLFSFHKHGEIWLEIDIPNSIAILLQEGDEIKINFMNKSFTSEILYISHEIEVQNQSRKVKVSTPSKLDFELGLKGSVQISIPANLFKIPKIATTTIDEKQVVFEKVNGGFKVINLEVINSDDNFVYVKNTLNEPIAINGVVILKNILESSHD